VLPAAGVWPFYGLTAADSPHVLPTVSTSWPAFYGLRDDNVRALVAAGAEGIITFPSLHAALAVILVAALWPVARVRWVIFGLNALMLAATPIDGSHYFIDVLAGIAVCRCRTGGGVDRDGGQRAIGACRSAPARWQNSPPGRRPAVETFSTTTTFADCGRATNALAYERPHGADRKVLRLFGIMV